MIKIILPFCVLLNISISSQAFEIKFDAQRKPATSQIRLAFTGDLLVHDALYQHVIDSKTKDFSILWKKTIPLFEAADFAYANLEGPVALGINRNRQFVGDVGFTYDKIVYSGTNMVFNYHPLIIDSLIKSGLDIVSTANNHAYDRGSIGIDKTIEAMNEKGLQFVGTRSSKSQSDYHKIIQIKDMRVAWISCTEFINGFKDVYNQLLLCYNDANEIKNLIQKIKSEKLADVILVLPHWGVEYQHTPAAAQKKYAREFLEAGATAVIGSHPHVLQPAEKYLTKDQRETFIAYSLGNFVAYQKDIDRKSSAVVYLDLSKNADGQTWISGYSYRPTTRNSTDIFPADNLPDVKKHVATYLGDVK